MASSRSAPASGRGRGQEPRLMRHALRAAHAGHHVIPLCPRSKTAVLPDWESAATTEPRAIRSWWSQRPYNIGIACGPSGLYVLDLDQAHEHEPPLAWSGARDGQEVLARLATTAGQPYPSHTYTVTTPSGGQHLYFRAPAEPELRSTVARLGWRIDTRGTGGYIVAAGSVLTGGAYRVASSVAIAPLPAWLVDAVKPPPPPEPVELNLPNGRAGAYVAAIVDGETRAVSQALPGQRHDTLLRAAGRLGQLVGSGDLDEHTAQQALHTAAAVHIGHDGFTTREATNTIRDGLLWGRNRPRHITSRAE
ncbi:Bifunctional DNA primase/polymerase, N-terminal [Actinopolyspora alba]|uniref:Bifunctional DNA primase/polymerase, N-terminal n=1 Tax=Actinopolyspora alba TaxID=673379 RepID=A0A1I1YS31_9ACTN|nr:bifunctional DNA primase/polymerase [Actinopolyspora alba]SFE22327.1 Bifunctional DNA primase/polymerase, N-terminal [Actinopolyspora alba]